jgi:hypothetical protein
VERGDGKMERRRLTLTLTPVGISILDKYQQRDDVFKPN